MFRSYQPDNVPIELLRTFAAIHELGSFSKAAEKLGLSQPGISAQNKRLQILVGGAVFGRVPGGVALTERGRLILPHALKVLEASDQILGIGGSAPDVRSLRVGISDLFSQRLFKTYDHTRHGPFVITCNTSSELKRGVIDGYIDIACMLEPQTDEIEIIASWTEHFIWARKRELAISPGMPIPLVGWTAAAIDKVAVKALESRGLSYKFMFESVDWQTRRLAAAAGCGIIAVLDTDELEPLVVAKEYYLPPFPTVTAGIVVRNGVDRQHIAGAIEMLKSLSANAPLQIDT